MYRLGRREKETAIGHTENHHEGGMRYCLFPLSSSESVERHRGETHAEQHVNSISDKKWIRECDTRSH